MIDLSISHGLRLIPSTGEPSPLLLLLLSIKVSAKLDVEQKESGNIQPAGSNAVLGFKLQCHTSKQLKRLQLMKAAKL